MFEGMASRDKDPRKSLHVEEVADARARAGRGAGRRDGQRDQLQHRVDLDLRAGVDVRRSWSATAGSRRWPSGTTCPTTWSAPTCPASCCAPARACNAWKPGDEVVAHCLSVELEHPDGHNDTMLDPRAADLGLRDQLRRPGRARPGQDQPADAQAGPPDLGGGRRPRAGQLHGVPAAGLAQRRRHEAGRRRADLGRVSGGLGSYATQMALGGGATPVCVVSSPEKAEICRAMGAELVIDRSARGLPVLEGRAHPGPARSGSGSAATIRELTGGDDLDIVFEHPGRETFGASVYVARRGGTIVTCASTSGLPARVRQPLPVDEPQADHRLALRQLPRGVGGQRAGRARA